MADPECRQLQQAFLPLVARDLTLIDRVLRQSPSAEQRGIAAYVLQYGSNPKVASTFIAKVLR